MADADKPESAIARVKKRLARLRARQSRPELIQALPRDDATQQALVEFMPTTRRHRWTASRPNSTREETAEYVDYWRAIMMRKWIILGLTFLVALITALIVKQMTPVYRSTVTMLIETDPTKLFPVGDSGGGVSLYFREYFQTQAEILKSREVAQRVVKKVKLDTFPEFDPRPKAPSRLGAAIAEFLSPLKEYFANPPTGPTPASMETEVLRRYSDRLFVEPVRNSQLIKVSFESADPALAALVANATAQAYIQANADARSRVNQSAGQQINERLEELRTTLNASEKALQAYREREGMLDNKSTVLGGTARQLDELTQKLVESRVRRSEAEQAYLQVNAGKATNYESVPAVVKSLAIQHAKQVEAEAEKKLAEISQRYGPDHPRYTAASSELGAARANTRKQIQNLVASIAKEYEAASATEKAIQTALNQSKSTIQSLNRKGIQLDMLERDAATNRQLYQAFLSRFKENSATRNAVTENARVVDAAVTSLTPVRPNKTRTVLLAAALTMILGMLGAVLLHRLRNTLRTSEDVEQKLSSPMLAALPILPRRRSNYRGQVVLDRPHDLYSESIRIASAGIMLSSLNTPNKIIAITSCVLDEGKSTFAINLAHSQAKTKQVLLIEGDMRRPSFAKSMILTPGQKGLADLLAGTATLEESLLQVKGADLHVIAAGHIPPNPQELLVSRAFSDLLVTLHSRYDMIIIDTPPIQLVSDGLIIGAQSTGIILIVKADETPVPMARRALQRITSANIPIFGVILNQQNFHKAEKYYGEYSGYGKYWYGTGYEAGR